VARGGGNEYRLKFHFGADRHIGIQATKLVSGHETGLGHVAPGEWLVRAACLRGGQHQQRTGAGQL
jgi:hypothetical protein